MSDTESCTESSETMGSSGSYTSESSDYVDDDVNDEYLGMVLHGKYVLLYKIGYGAFSTVWLSYLINDPRKVYYYAIKIQNPDDYEDGMVELKLLQKLKRFQSPHLIELIDYFEFKPPESTCKDPALCMVFDLMACSVYQLIRRGKYKEGLPAKVVYRIAQHMLLGLQHLHNLNVVHTDIKPENLLIKGRERKINEIIRMVEQYDIANIYATILEEEKILQNHKPNNKERLKKIKRTAQQRFKKRVEEIMEPIKASLVSNQEKELDRLDNIEVVLSDFGTVYAKEDLEPDLDIQTRYYRSPEVILQCGCDEKCDMWSVGCMLYEILTGDILFDPEKDRKHGRDFHHIYWIVQICGDVPESMIRRSPRRKEFFDKKCKLLVKAPERWSVKEIIDDCGHADKGTYEYNKLVTLIEGLLQVLPKNRLTVKSAIEFLSS